MSEPRRRRIGAPTVRPVSIDLASPPSQIDFGDADELQVLALVNGTPFVYIRVPNPGSGAQPRLLSALLDRYADGLRESEQLITGLRRRLGKPEDRYRRLACSVVVCTHRRSRYLPQLLDALAELDPGPDEIVVVDNDPGEHDCRAEVARRGARYVREDRRGLDNARNAGLLAARGELIAFTDDDCVPATTWLRSLGELFDDPSVAAVTGPAFAYRLDTPAQVRFEHQGGHRRGLARRVFDWTNLAPVAASRTGIGANMILRRSVLDKLGEVFPPELDAGTPTESGGDVYALYRILAAGYRVVYDPGTYVFHQHRPDARTLHTTIRGYGVGLSAVLTKLLLEHGELSVPFEWRRLWLAYRHAVRQALTGTADPVDVRIGWDYLRGGLLGAGAWASSVRAARRWPESRRSAGDSVASAGPVTADRVVGPPPLARSPRGAVHGTGRKKVSVVVTAPNARGSCDPCRDGLAQQSLPSDEFEVIVSSAPGQARNAAARSARGDLLVFLDGDLCPEPELLERHLEAHRGAGGELIAVGYWRYSERGPGLAAMLDDLRWEDHHRFKQRAVAMTFVEVVTANLSLPRATFERLGGFDPDLPRPSRDGWGLGLRALEAGVEVRYEPRAGAARHGSPTTRALLGGAHEDGRADALLRARHPTSMAVMAAAPAPGLGQVLRRLPARLAASSATREATTVALDVLERLRARRSWLALFSLACRATYEQARTTQGKLTPARGGPPQASVELASDEPIEAPHVAAPVVELTVRARVAQRLIPTNGHWSGWLAEQVADVLDWKWWIDLPLERPLEFESSCDGGGPLAAAVLFGPDHHDGDIRNRRAIEAAGGQVELAVDREAGHWCALDRSIRGCAADLVVVPLPGFAPGAACLASAQLALGGDRVALLVGSAAGGSERLRALVLASRRAVRAPYPLIGRAPSYVAVRRSLYEACGGFDAQTARFGAQAPILDLCERALERGYLVAFRETPVPADQRPSRRARRRHELRRHQARGALMLGDVLDSGRREGVLWFARRALWPQARVVLTSMVSGHPRRRLALGSTAGLLSGAVLAARRTPARRASVGG